jgi:transglutaminase-like putative cysteine protease
MRQKFFLVCLFLIGTGFAFSQYDASSIPKDLLENANAVIRNQDIRFFVRSPGRATLTVKEIVTILNEKGRSWGVLYIPYYTNSYATFLGGAVYNKFGKLEMRIANKFVKDYSEYGGSLYEDSRVLYYEPAMRTYPYTVEYHYQITYIGFLGIPGWSPTRSTGISVENASYSLDIPEDYGFRYLESNFSAHADTEKKKSRIIYQWKVDHIRSISPQAYAKPAFNYLPAVHLAPDDFVMEGKSGSMRTWEDLSSWHYSLLLDRDKLPESTEKEVLSLVKDLNDDLYKARRIYEYMQSKTRYVSIQLGIGGWQPFEAKVVDEVGYGDCKALVNYTMALLKVAGISSYYAVVQAGTNASPILTDLPSRQFNHAILCLPLKGDTIWLECTNQHQPFGYLGSFTDNRYALLIKPNEGELVKTKAYNKNDNFRNRDAHIILDGEGNAEIKMTTEYSGLDSDIYFSVIRQGSEDQKNWLANYISLPGFQLNKYSFDKNFDIIPSVKSEILFSVKNYASKSGKRIFLPLNQLSRWTSVPGSKPVFVRDIYLRNASTQTDHFSFEVPEEFNIEAIPNPVFIESRFGEYYINVERTGNNLLYKRSFFLKEGVFPSDGYDELNEFLQKISLADQSQVILIRE